MNTNHPKRCLLVVFLFFLVSSSAGAATIKLVADEWPPYNIKPNTYCENSNNEKLCEGYIVDIAREIFEKHDHEVKYYVMPWKRAIQEVRSGKQQGLIGADQRDGKGFIFPEAEMSINTLSFYVKKGNSWRFNGETSLRDISIGTIKGYGYRKWLHDYIQKNKNDHTLVQEVAGGSALKMNIKKLINGRVDVIVDSEATIRYMAKQMGYLDDIEPAGYGTSKNKIFLVFSPNDEYSATYAQILTEGVKELRKSGRLTEILNYYGLTDWKK